MLCAFMCEGYKGGESYLAERQKEEVRERERERERELTTEKDSVGAKIRAFSQTTNGNVL
jgi:hypothetical protein